jgi:putative hydrolase of the HAD superfamily
MKDLRAILVDFGGTLDSDGKHWSTQFAESFAAAGVVCDRAALDEAFLATDRAINAEPAAATMMFAAYVQEYASRMSLHLGQGSVPQVVAHFLAQAREHFRRNRVLVAALQSRYLFAIVSNFTANLPLIVKEAELAGVVRTVVCSAIEGVRKPEPAIYRLALERLGVEAAEAAMIGDSLGNDIEPAKALGLTTIWLRGDKDHSRGNPAAADHVVGTFAEALSVLSRDQRGNAT